MMLNTSAMIEFMEMQKFRQKWIILIVGVIALLSWWAFIQQIVFESPFGSNPAPDYVIYILLAIFGIALPLFIFGYRMETVVNADFILVKMTLLGKRLIQIDEIKECYAREYRPIMEYGGWGWRWSPSMGVAYNVTGNKGVQLKLKNGRMILIGSQRPEQLAERINNLRKGP